MQNLTRLLYHQGGSRIRPRRIRVKAPRWGEVGGGWRVESDLQLLYQHNHFIYKYRRSSGVDLRAKTPDPSCRKVIRYRANNYAKIDYYKRTRSCKNIPDIVQEGTSHCLETVF
ncbi:Hypothetical predicted protein [Xyrichtys novacula]|uniref:Uncharacterized protein n=1 Tax=Xyrichtys novacula TaxID=13765 RepID=A0AAV1FDI1_XYRNO|nr:Hypothetical predicted protein [Xyrichtys novacula]